MALQWAGGKDRRCGHRGRSAGLLRLLQEMGQEARRRGVVLHPEAGSAVSGHSATPRGRKRGIRAQCDPVTH